MQKIFIAILVLATLGLGIKLLVNEDDPYLQYMKKNDCEVAMPRRTDSEGKIAHFCNNNKKETIYIDPQNLPVQP